MLRLDTSRKIAALVLAIAVAVIGTTFVASRVPSADAQDPPPTATPTPVPPTAPPAMFTYAAKVVCAPELGKPSLALVSAWYRTAVNVLNPGPEPVHIQQRLILSLPQGQVPIIGDWIEESLEPWAAFDVDCIHLRHSFGLQGVSVPGGKGFLVIQSDRELVVAAVYTTRKVTKDGGVGVSIDVEYIHPLKGQMPLPSPPPPQDLPNLLVDYIDQPAVDCPSGSGSCNVTFTFGVKNIGLADALDDIDVLVEAEEVADITVGIYGGLAAGGHTLISVTLGPGGNCYNPDCTVRVTVDHTNVIEESDETDNTLESTHSG